MRFSFIGMSNIGKTYWSKRIASDKGLTHICCDTLIEQKLGPELTKLGYRGLRDMAKWMGQPPDPHYAANSGIYRAHESAAMRATLERLRAEADLSAVIDTTGSVIYTGADILSDLCALTRVVYFEASEAHIENLFRRYLAHPKPVIWSENYLPLPGESPRETLQRCYPELLRTRARHYRDIAHVTIPFEKHRNHGSPIAGLMDMMTA